MMSSYEKGVAGEKQVLRSLNDPSAVWQKQIDFEGNKYRLDIFIPKSKIIEVKNIAFGNVSLSQRLTSQALSYKAIADDMGIQLEYYFLNGAPDKVVNWLSAQGINVIH